MTAAVPHSPPESRRQHPLLVPEQEDFDEVLVFVLPGNVWKRWVQVGEQGMVSLVGRDDGKVSDAVVWVGRDD